jgi:hypothetical protein
MDRLSKPDNSLVKYIADRVICQEKREDFESYFSNNQTNNSTKFKEINTNRSFIKIVLTRTATYALCLEIIKQDSSNNLDNITLQQVLQSAQLKISDVSKFDQWRIKKYIAQFKENIAQYNNQPTTYNDQPTTNKNPEKSIQNSAHNAVGQSSVEKIYKFYNNNPIEKDKKYTNNLDQSLESKHNYIQLLAPTITESAYAHKESHFNSKTQIREFYKIHGEQFIRYAKIMFDFWGINAELNPSLKWSFKVNASKLTFSKKPAFDEYVNNPKGNHNNARITRMIESLRLYDKIHGTNFSEQFCDFLLHTAKKSPAKTLEFWRNCIKNTNRSYDGLIE